MSVTVEIFVPTGRRILGLTALGIATIAGVNSYAGVEVVDAATPPCTVIYDPITGNPYATCNTLPPSGGGGGGGQPPVTVKPKTKPKPSVTTTTLNPDIDGDGFLPDSDDPTLHDYKADSPGAGDAGVADAAKQGINVDRSTDEGNVNAQIARSVAEKDWQLIITDFGRYGVVVMKAIPPTTSIASSTTRPTPSSALPVTTPEAQAETVPSVTIVETAAVAAPSTQPAVSEVTTTSGMLAAQVKIETKPTDRKPRIMGAAIAIGAALGGILFISRRRKDEDGPKKSTRARPVGV